MGQAICWGVLRSGDAEAPVIRGDKNAFVDQADWDCPGFSGGSVEDDSVRGRAAGNVNSLPIAGCHHFAAGQVHQLFGCPSQDIVIRNQVLHGTVKQLLIVAEVFAPVPLKEYESCGLERVLILLYCGQVVHWAFPGFTRYKSMAASTSACRAAMCSL